MDPIVEKIIKLVVFAILVISGIAYWVVPKTSLRKKLKMNESLYISTQVIGIVCGIIGLVVTIVYPQHILELHLWELLLLPYVVIMVYWLIIMKIRKTTVLIDEKQEQDMGKAGGMAFAISFPLMVLIFTLYQNEVITGLLWFPIYIFVSLMVFSSSILLYYKKG